MPIHRLAENNIENTVSMKTRPILTPGCLLGAAILYAVACRAQTTVTQIAAGFSHTLFIKSDGSLWAMGANFDGQLGDGTGAYQTNQPEMVVSNGVTAVCAAGYHSFFTVGSTLWAMGDNLYGELGDGTYADRYVPEQLTGVLTMGTGPNETLFTRSDSVLDLLYIDLYATGDNYYGELGDGTTNSTSTAVRIERDNPDVAGDYYVTAVTGGEFHSLFTKSDGSLWGMGDDYYGELGDGAPLLNPNSYTNRPEMIVSSGVTAIAAYGYGSMFLKSDGSLWTMGYNVNGQLGDGSFSDTNRPVRIETSGVTAIAGGSDHNLFLKSDGSLWGMGYNSTGQLGVGNTNSSSVPLQIVAGGVTAVAGGSDFSLFLASDGSLWGMGNNYYGQLGAWPASPQTRPVEMVGPIVGNGGFEMHDFTGWTVTPPTFASVVTGVSHSGQWSARIGQVGSLALLSQTLLTTPGTKYLLSFWLNCDGETINEFTASWNGTTLFAQTNLPSTGGWSNMQFVVTATGTTTALTFGFRDDPSFIEFDDVSVVPLIQPVITGISLAATNLVLSASNGLWNGTYETLTSTNLSQPLSQWTPLATNTLDGSGAFTIMVTNGVNSSDSQHFYTLLLQ